MQHALVESALVCARFALTASPNRPTSLVILSPAAGNP